VHAWEGHWWYANHFHNEGGSVELMTYLCAIDNQTTAITSDWNFEETKKGEKEEKNK
jgi:hypothetical protein